LGHPLGACAKRDLEQVQHRRGVLFQQGALFSALSVFDNVALPLRELKMFPGDVRAEMVMFALSAVGIEARHAVKMPAELSGGYGQAGGARALAGPGAVAALSREPHSRPGPQKAPKASCA
jgi:ABC-type transporter Mla maintaining outer membrane lipid asymmetry ATPase subunit MlaF